MQGALRIEEVSKFGTAAEGAVGRPLYRSVPRSNDICWSSFVCSGGSLESSRRSANRDKIADGKTTDTAITFHCTVEFANMGATKIGVSENATGLANRFAGVNQECGSDDSEGEGESEGSDADVPVDNDLDDNVNDQHTEISSVQTSTACGGAVPMELPIPLGLNENMSRTYMTLHRNNCVVTHLILNNKDFLIPVKRARVWFLWCNCRNLRAGAEVALERLHRAQAKILQMREVLKDKRLPIETLTLSPPDHPMLLEEMDRRKAKLLQKVQTNAKENGMFEGGATILKPSWYIRIKKNRPVPRRLGRTNGRVPHKAPRRGSEPRPPYRERCNVWYQALGSQEKYNLYLTERVFPRQG